MEGMSTSADEKPITASRDDYLMAIFRALATRGRATTRTVSELAGVSAASTTNMLKRLAAEGLVEYERYRGAGLTDAGRRRALRMIRRHRITERFLTDVVGLPWDRADAVTDDLEHALPDEVIDRFDAMLGHPLTCPHGHPIPRPDGTMPHIPARPLAALRPGETARVARVDDRDGPTLRFLAEAGLVPGNEVRLLGPPAGGYARIRAAGADRTIPARLLRTVFVAGERRAAGP